MKINFSIINKIRPESVTLKKRFAMLSKTSPPDLFESNQQPLKTISQIITAIAGSYSKEDLKVIDVLTRHFKEYKTDLNQTKQEIAETLRQEISRHFLKAKDSELFLFDSEHITSDLKKRVKYSMLNMLAIKKLQNGSNIYASPAPLSSWYKTNLGIHYPEFEPSRFTHPIDKAKKLTGELTSEDTKNIKHKESSFYTLNNEKIQNKKLRILQKLHTSFLKNESDFIGTYSNRELKKLKKQIIKYEALNNIQKKRGIYTKNIEQTLFATPIPENLNQGDYINGLGLVVNKFSLKEKPAIIVLSLNKNGFNQFKMYDLEKLKTADCADKEKDSLISEIQFKHIQDHYLVQSFENHHPKKYPDGGKIIGLQLMSLLAEKNCKPVNIEALAYGGNKRSPVNYYMYYGFTPVDFTAEEIENLANQNGGRFPYEKPVKLALNDFEQVRERIKRMEKIYFS